MSQTWNSCVEILKDRISTNDFNEWVAPLQPIQVENTLKLLAPNRYVRDHVKKNIRHLIEETLTALNDEVILVQIEIGTHTSPTPESKKKIPNKTASATKSAKPAKASPTYESSVMTDSFIFENHIEGNSNQLARAAALQVGKNPGSPYANPLFIYGGVGLGKTHLMQAAGHLIRKTNPHAKVLYIRAELFVNDMVNALRDGTMHDFKRHYRSHSTLLIDDVHFFSRKPNSQEELFHTFNTLFESKQQIIMTNDSIASALSEMDPRLVSRFGGGLSVSVDPPELETRVAILERKAEDLGLELPEDVAFFVASSIRSNVRELEGALNSIKARVNFTGCAIDLESARETLGDLLAHQEKQMNIDNIKRIVAEYFQLRISDLHSTSRVRRITRPRQLAMFFTKENTSLSLPQIGENFGGRDHTTVLHAYRQITKLLKTDVKLKEDYQNLQRILGV